MGGIYDKFDEDMSPKSWEEMQEWLEHLQERYKSFHPWVGPEECAWKLPPAKTTGHPYFLPIKTVECIGGEFHGRFLTSDVGVFGEGVTAFTGGDQRDIYELIGNYVQTDASADHYNETICICIATGGRRKA